MAGSCGGSGCEFDVEEKRAQEEVAAQAFVDQHGVLAEPAQAGAAGKIALQQRGRVHDGPAPAAGLLTLGPSQQPFQPFAEDIVVVGTLGIAGDLTSVRGTIGMGPAARNSWPP